MFEGLLAVHVVIAIALVALILLNQGKGADMGAAFGSGASSTVFGSQGAAPFMTKLIATLGTSFFLTSLGLAVIASQGAGSSSVVEEDEPSGTVKDEPEQPAAPGEEGQGSGPAAPGKPVEAPAEPPEEP